MAQVNTVLSERTYQRLVTAIGRDEAVEIASLLGNSSGESNTVLEFGVKGDYSGAGTGTDNSARIQAAVDAMALRVVPNASGSAQPVQLVFPELPSNRAYRISRTVYVPPQISIIMLGKVIYTGSADEPAFEIGDPDYDTANCDYVLRVERETLSDWTDEECVGVRIINAARCRIYPTWIRNFAIGLQGVGDTQGFTYNTIYTPIIGSCGIGIDLQAKGSSNGYATQNTFIGGSVFHQGSTNLAKPRTGIRFSKGVGGTNAHNNNLFLNTSIELMRNDALFWSSTATAGTSTTLSDAAKTFTDSHIGAEIIIDGGTGKGQSRLIASRNSSTQVTLDRSWNITPDTTSTYRMQAMCRAVHLIEGQENKFINLRGETNGFVLVRTENDARRNFFGWGSNAQNSPLGPSIDNLRVEEVGTYRDHELDIPEMHWGRQISSWSSGHIPSKTVATSDKINTAGMSWFRTADANFGLIRTLNVSGITIDDCVRLTSAACGPGVLLNTTKSHRFVVSKQCDPDRVGYLVVRTYDGHPRHGGSLIGTADYETVRSHRGAMTWNTNFGGCRTVLNGTLNEDVCLTFTPDVKYAGIAWVDCDISSMAIASIDEGSIEVEAGHGYDDGRNYLDSAPSAGSYLIGREVFTIAPSDDAPQSYICTASGSPGTWSSKLGYTTSSWSSGNIPANTAANATNYGIKGMHITQSAAATMLTQATHGGIDLRGAYLNVTSVSRTIGQVVNTTKNKRFILKKSADPADPGTFYIRCYDGNPLFGGAVIGGSGDLRVSSPTVTLAWQTTFGGCHGANSASDQDIVVTFDSTVKYAAIEVFSGGIASLEIQALDGYAIECFPGHGAGSEHAYLNTVPTSGAQFIGQVVYNSAMTSILPLGWYASASGSPGTWFPFYRAQLVLTGSKTHDFGNLAAGASESTTVTVTGAALGNRAVAALSIAIPDGFVLNATVSAADTVKVTLANVGGATTDIASATLSAQVFQ